MYSSGIVRYHPMHDPESQKQQPSRSSLSRLRLCAVPSFADPRLYRSSTAHMLCAVGHVAMLIFAMRGTGLAGNAASNVSWSAATVASIVALINFIFSVLSMPMELSAGPHSREFSTMRYIVFYAGCIFGCGSAIVDFKYTVRAGVLASGWGDMRGLEACAVLAGLVSLFMVAVNGFKAYQTWNAVNVALSVPKIKIEDMSGDSKESHR